VLYGRHEQLLELDGLYHYFYSKDKVSAKLEPGNPNYELAWGSAAIIDYLERLGQDEGRPAIKRAFEAIAEHETKIGEQLLSWLGARNDIRIVGERGSSAALRVPTISFCVEGKAPGDIVRRIDQEKIGVRHGDFHSRRLIEALGLARGGPIRVSMVHYNTESEVGRLIRTLDMAMR